MGGRHLRLLVCVLIVLSLLVFGNARAQPGPEQQVHPPDGWGPGASALVPDIDKDGRGQVVSIPEETLTWGELAAQARVGQAYEDDATYTVGGGPLPEPTPTPTPQEGELGTLVGPRRVVVSELPSLPPAASLVEEPIVIPRRAPGIGVRAWGADAPQAPRANALDSAARVEPQPLAPPDILTSFEGLDSTDNPVGFTPADPQIAVGPDHVVEFVNIVGRITDKSSVPVGPDFLLAEFFLVPPGNINFDPKIIYDDDVVGRFFASYADIDFAVFPPTGHVYLAISQTSDPTDSWNVYRLSCTGCVPDTPAIGVTNDKFTLSANLFDLVSGLFIGERTIVVQKSDVMAGEPAADVGIFFFDIRPDRFGVRPAQNLSPGNDQYLTTWDLFSFDQLTVIRITGTPEEGNVTEAAATNLTTFVQVDPPPSVTAGAGSCIVRGSDLGPPPCIDSGGFQMREAVWRDNSLWSAASDACIPPGDTVRSCAHLVEVETVGTPSVVQDMLFGGPAGHNWSFPAIRTDASHNLHVSLTHTSPSIFAEARVAGRLASDPLGTMSGSCLLKEGEVVHTSGRWGDYMGAAVDPSDPSKVWVVGQYAKDDGFVRWGTHIASLSFSASGLCPPIPDVVVSVGDGTAAPGGSITVPVEVLGVPPGSLGPADINIEYPPALLDATACDPDPDGVFDVESCDVAFDNNDIPPDAVQCLVSDVSGESGDLTICTITFDVSVECPPGGPPILVTPIVLTLVDPSEAPILFTTEPGEITCELPFTLGDVNCDDERNVIDALFVLQHDVGLRAASEECPPPSGALFLPACDVNDDSSCNVIDALFILQCDVGITNVLCPPD